MAGKLPAIQFYPGDWLKDSVAGCSIAAQGLWLRMMFIMHESEHYGYLSTNGSPIPSQVLARRTGCDSLEQYDALLVELETAGVPSRTSNGVIYSRRMVRDHKARQLERIKWRQQKRDQKVNHANKSNGVNSIFREDSTPDSALFPPLSSSSSSSSKQIPPTVPQTGTEPMPKKTRKRKPPDPSQEYCDVWFNEPWPSIRRFVAKYNRECPDNWPQVSIVADGLKEKITQYLRMFPSEGFWTKVYSEANLSRSKYCRYYHDAGLPWLLQKGQHDHIENCLKVHDGKYRN